MLASPNNTDVPSFILVALSLETAAPSECRPRATARRLVLGADGIPSAKSTNLREDAAPREATVPGVKA